MMAVIFEVEPKDGKRQAYLDIAAEPRLLFDKMDGFISIERCENLTQPGKVLSLSFFRDESFEARLQSILRRLRCGSRRARSI
jgi:heme-degrading monooxygenase HmoA